MIDAAWAKVISDWAMFGAGIIGGGGAAIWGVVRRHDRALHERLDTIQAQAGTVAERITARVASLEASRPGPVACGEHGERLAKLEQHIALALNHDDMNRAHKRMDQFEGQISQIMGTLSAIEHQTNMLVQHLLQHGPRAGDRRE